MYNQADTCAIQVSTVCTLLKYIEANQCYLGKGNTENKDITAARTVMWTLQMTGCVFTFHSNEDML